MKKEITGQFIALLVLVLMMIIVSGCGLLNLPTFNAPKPADMTYKYSQTFEKNPQLAQIGDKTFVWESQKQTVDVNYDRKDKPLSWWQKLCNWIGNLGLLGIMAVVAGLILAPAGTIGFLYSRYAGIKKALTQTVKAIDESKAVAENEALKNALSSKQDTDTKMMIDVIKRT